VYRKLGEGTFSEVLKAESVKTRQKVAIKCMKSYFDNIEKVKKVFLICQLFAQVQNLREIKALQRLSPHPHIIQLIEVL
jgi:renal tumor antigen